MKLSHGKIISVEKSSIKKASSLGRHLRKVYPYANATSTVSRSQVPPDYIETVTACQQSEAE